MTLSSQSGLLLRCGLKELKGTFKQQFTDRADVARRHINAIYLKS